MEGTGLASSCGLTDLPLPVPCSCCHRDRLGGNGATGRRLPLQTRFYLDGDRVLYIRGGDDPFLISEELAQLASALVLIGVTQSPVMKSAQMSTFTSATMLPRRVVREPEISAM